MFKVTDDSSAGWAFRKLAEIKLEKQRINDLAEQEKQRIDTWQKKELEPLENSIIYFEALLEDHFRELRAENPKAKLSTPWGKVTSRTAQNWQWEDDTVLEWLAKTGDIDHIRVRRSVDKAAMRKNFTVHEGVVISPHGEVVEGVKVTPRTTYKVDVIE